MKYTNLGNSDLIVSSVTFGAWAIGGWMWGGADKKEAILAIQKGYDLGITSIDTAAVYGFGVSEEIVGEAIKGNREHYEILTKFGMHWDSTKGEFYFSTTGNNGEKIDLYRFSGKESVIAECDKSLKRLGTDYIDLYQIHWPDPTTPIHETMEAIELLKKQGKIREAGVCNYSSQQMEEAEQTTELVSNQVPYSMLKRDIETDLVPYTIKNHKSILAYSPLQRGILTGKIGADYKFQEGDSRANLPLYSQEKRARINAFLTEIQPLAKEKNITLAQLVLAWTLAQPGISVVLAGARNMKQVTENAKAADVQLSDNEIQTITSELNNLNI